MAKPTLTTVYPNPNQTSVPVGAEIEIVFDQSVDLSTVKKSVVLYGKDKDFVSGPGGAKWISEGQSNDPFFLKSPGFTGVVECQYKLVYVDSSGNEYEFNTEVLEPAQEVSAGVTHKLIITPTSLMREEMSYYLKIIGDSEGGVTKGISKRTVYDIDYSQVTSTDGKVLVYGGYNETVDDIVYIEIKNAGNIGEVDYDFWFDSDPANKYTGKLASRRYRRLENGLQIKFDGSNFVQGDIYSFKVFAPEYLENSYDMNFETSTDTIVEVPSTMSTSPIGPQLPVNPTLGYLEHLEMDPEDGSSNQLFKDKQIVLTFGNDIDPATITQDSVKVFAYPVSGVYSDTPEAKELFKKLTVSNNKIIIGV